jgi:hypothetical protein
VLLRAHFFIVVVLMLAGLIAAVQGVHVFAWQTRPRTTHVQHEKRVSIASRFAIVLPLKQKRTGRRLLCDTT